MKKLFSFLFIPFYSLAVNAQNLDVNNQSCLTYRITYYLNNTTLCNLGSTATYCVGPTAGVATMGTMPQV